MAFSAEIYKKIQKFLGWGSGEGALLLRDSLLPALVIGVFACYCETMLHSIMTTRLLFFFKSTFLIE